MACVRKGWALIFDLDGVVVDSMPAHTEAWRRYLRALGVEPDDIAERMHGRRNDEIIADILGAHLPADIIAGHGAAKERLYREIMQAELHARLVPGVAEFLAACDGTPVGLASNAEPANIDFVLDGAGLRKHFQAIVDGHQVVNPKPAPDVYLRAAELLQTSPNRCVVFEDSPAGVSAGRAAGAKVVGVQTHPADLAGVDFSIRDFRDEALKGWLKGLDGAR